MTPYAAANAALNNYSRALAAEVGEHGVRVVCVLPGFVVTDGATAHLQRTAAPVSHFARLEARKAIRVDGGIIPTV